MEIERLGPRPSLSALIREEVREGDGNNTNTILK